MKQLIAFSRNINDAKLIRSANYVKHELAVRLAHRIRDFQALPFIVGSNVYISTAYDLYYKAFERFRKLPEIKNLGDNSGFCELLKKLLEEHQIIIPCLAKGMRSEAKNLDGRQMDTFMNNLLRTRIGRRVLAEQHICLTEYYHNNLSNKENKFGVIESCRAVDMIRRCSDLAKKSSNNAVAGIDKVGIEISGDFDCVFTYIPDQIEYILFELLKNALKYQRISNVTRKIDKPVEVLVVDCSSRSRSIVGAQENSSIVFRISDCGGGFNKDILPHDDPDKVWSFSHQFLHSKEISTGTEDNTQKMEGKLSDEESVGNSLNIGIQLARVFANYWGGEIKICSMYGYGSDIYVRIETGGDTSERLTFVE